VRATGKSIEITELDRAAAAAQFARFMPAEEAEAVLQFLYYAAAGNSPATTTIADVLSRPAIGFDEWAADHTSDF
jgi:hypothetical protein